MKGSREGTATVPGRGVLGKRAEEESTSTWTREDSVGEERWAAGGGAEVEASPETTSEELKIWVDVLMAEVLSLFQPLPFHVFFSFLSLSFSSSSSFDQSPSHFRVPTSPACQPPPFVAIHLTISIQDCSPLRRSRNSSSSQGFFLATSLHEIPTALGRGPSQERQ